MLCCGVCSQWQHIACHDRADAQAGRPRRNWDQVEFLCRQCQARRVAAKSSGQYSQHTLSNSYVPPAPMVPSTSYSPYAHGPPATAAHLPRQYPPSYPVTVNGGGTAYTLSRQRPYPTIPPANHHQQVQLTPPPPRHSAGPSYAQQYQAAYDRSPAQFPQITPNVNGHRAVAYQVI
jgi:hypothetical protein